LISSTTNVVLSKETSTPIKHFIVVSDGYITLRQHHFGDIKNNENELTRVSKEPNISSRMITINLD
jgi:hypothetical protein